MILRKMPEIENLLSLCHVSVFGTTRYLSLKGFEEKKFTMSDKEDHFASSDVAPLPKEQRHPGKSIVRASITSLKTNHFFNNIAKWYRSTFYNMTILGLCNLAAPGIWGAMNSLGAGGSQSPQLVNAANALTFCLMVVSCYFSSVIIRYIGVKGALIFGT